MPDGKWVSKANLQTFWQMIRSKSLPTMIGDTVTTWLNDHVTPTGSAVVVDDTLTIEGAAADAKKTGDEISGLKEDFNINNDFIATKSEAVIGAAWKYGRIDSGVESETAYRSISVDYIPREKISSIFVPYGYKSYAFYYNLVSDNYVYQDYYSYKQADTQDETYMLVSGHGDYIRMQTIPISGEKMTSDQLNVVKLFQKMQITTLINNLLGEVDDLENIVDVGAQIVPCSWTRGGLRYNTGEEFTSSYRTRMVNYELTENVDFIHTPDWALTEILYFNSLNERQYGESYAKENYVAINKSYNKFRVNAYIISGGRIQDDQVSAIKLLNPTDPLSDQINLEVFNSWYIGRYKFDNSAKKNSFCDLFTTETKKIETFLFYTDPHWLDNENAYLYKPMCIELQNAFNTLPLSFIVDNGDWLGKDDTPQQACEKIGKMDGEMRGMFGNYYYPVAGNHDFNSHGTQGISANVLKNLHFRQFEALNYVFNGRNTTCIVLNTGTVSTNGNPERIAQVKWFAEQLANGTANHYAVFSHAYFINTGSDVDYIPYNCGLIADAFNNRTTIVYEGTTYDYSGKSGRVEFFMTGHTHRDMNTKVGTIPVIVTANTSQGRIPTFDCVYADYTNRVLHCVRIGIGSDRNFNLDTGDIITE